MCTTLWIVPIGDTNAAGARATVVLAPWSGCSELRRGGGRRHGRACGQAVMLLALRGLAAESPVPGRRVDDAAVALGWWVVASIVPVDVMVGR